VNMLAGQERQASANVRWCRLASLGISLRVWRWNIPLRPQSCSSGLSTHQNATGND